MADNKKTAIESGRAEFALNEVKRVKSELSKEGQNEYKAYCKKFPSMILTNGLAAACAFAYEQRNKKNGAWGQVYKHTEDWLKSYILFDNNKNLLEYLCNSQSAEYRAVTKETLALFNWIRRFASGMIEKGA